MIVAASLAPAALQRCEGQSDDNQAQATFVPHHFVRLSCMETGQSFQVRTPDKQWMQVTIPPGVKPRQKLVME